MTTFMNYSQKFQNQLIEINFENVLNDYYTIISIIKPYIFVYYIKVILRQFRCFSKNLLTRETT
jgi:hypothetical protein